MTNINTNPAYDSNENTALSEGPIKAVGNDNNSTDGEHSYSGEWLSKPLGLCINEKIQNKHSGAKGFPNSEFKPATLTIQGLEDAVKAGHAFCALMDGDRNKENFVSSDLIVIDIDDGLTLEQAQIHPLVVDCATLIYTSASHTADHHKFRIIFVLEKTISDPVEFEEAVGCFIREFNADRKPKSAASLFYGNTDAQTFLANKGLSTERLGQFLASAEVAAAKKIDIVRYGATKRSFTCVGHDEKLRTASGTFGTLTSLPAKTKIHCPYHDDKNPSAQIFETMSGRRFIRCFSDKCDATYWDDSYDDFQFDDFERTALSFEKSTSVNKKLGAYRCVAVSQYSDSAVQLPAQFTDLTFIKSSKGTGKTQMLESIFASEHSFRVLSISHRRSLVRHMCNKLQLNCYLDQANREKNRFERYGVCLDSLEKIPENAIYDFVILDESEQILSHFFSDTMSPKSLGVIKKLRRIFASSKHVIALDADLSWTSYNTLSDMVIGGSSKQTQVFINKHRSGAGKQIERYRSKNQLVGDLFRSIEENKRCYVVCNTKELVNRLAAAITERFPSKETLLTITADSAKGKGDPASLFMQAPEEEAQKYQVVISSPVLSSGISLEFKDSDFAYDVVYGFFDAAVTDHFECDQQLGRVRGPKAVKVFVSPANFYLETDMDVVYSNIQKHSMFAYLRKDDPAQTDQFHEDDDFIRLGMRVTSVKRASINQLNANFWQYKRNQGFQIINVPDDQELIDVGKDIITSGKALSSEAKRRRIMQADDLSSMELRALISKEKSQEALTRKEFNALDRARIERFYRRDIFEGLIDLDKEGELRERVRLFELISTQSKHLLDPITPPVWPGYIIIKKPAWSKAEFLVKALSIAGVYAKGRFDPHIELSMDSLRPFVRFMMDNDHLYQSLFEKTLTKNMQKDAIKQLQVLLEMVHLKTGKRKKKNKDGNRENYYRLDQSRLNGMESLKRIRENRETDWPENDTGVSY